MANHREEGEVGPEKQDKRLHFAKHRALKRGEVVTLNADGLELDISVSNVYPSQEHYIFSGINSRDVWDTTTYWGLIENATPLRGL